MPPADRSATGVRCMMMRGGTSKGLYFLADDLPADRAERDATLLRIMGSPDPRQIDGLGGADSLTSKVAVVSPSTDPDADVDYLFLQVGVGEATVTDRQNCGNILAGVGPFAVERGLVRPGGSDTSVRIRMVNSGGLATARFATPGGAVRYDGDTAISGVPGNAAPIVLDFPAADAAPLPTGRLRDLVDGIEVTCVDNGMPVVIATADAFGLTGREPHADLAADGRLLERIDALRTHAAELMGLGDVSGGSVPKTVLVAPPADGGMLCVRSFIPVRPHSALGVLAAISAATGLLMPGAVGHELTSAWPPGTSRVDIEHPSGHLTVEVELDTRADPPRVLRSGVVRTARKLFDGTASA